MNRSIIVLGLSAIFACAIAVDCPGDDGEEPTYFPHETECGKFYECDHGDAYVLECPPGLYWDSRLNVCNRNVDCGDLLTSTASTSTTSTTSTEPPTEPPTEQPTDPQTDPAPTTSST